MDYTNIDLVQQAITSSVPIPPKDNAVLAFEITSVSRQIDLYCRQALGKTTYTNFQIQAQVNALGTLEFSVPSPVVQSITAFSYRIPGSNAIYPVSDLTLLLQEPRLCGVKMELVNYNFSAYRNRRFYIYISYVGGYSPLTTPSDPYPLPEDIQLAATRLVGWFYSKRNAPDGQVGSDQFGRAIISNSWPTDVKQALLPYRKFI